MVKDQGRVNKADILVGFYCTLPNQDEEIDKVFYQQLADVQ